METKDIITGEKIQAIADVYIGDDYYFNYNPWISTQTHKFKYISDFDNNQSYNNPKIIFCYGDLIKKFSDIIHLFLNPFILITHNSDENILPNKPEILKILDFEKLIGWHSQNVGLIHNKLNFLPIGIANRQWPHGDLNIFQDLFSMNLTKIKTKMIYMNFKLDTNINARSSCYVELINKIPFLEMTNPRNNLFRMAEYKFCICPEGNGLDTHRLWECFYLKVVPILLKNTYSINIKQKTNLPMVLLNKWEDLYAITTDYNIIYNLPDYYSFDFNSCQQYLKMNNYIKQIIFS